MDSTIVGSMNDNINMDSTIVGSMNDNINMDSTIVGSMNDNINTRGEGWDPSNRLNTGTYDISACSKPRPGFPTFSEFS
jgi:hypothetical protein